MSELEPSDHVASNRAVWNELASDYLADGRLAWSREEPRWGVFGVPEAEVLSLPTVAGCDVVELGCGTGYVSSWMLGLGAKSTIGLDNSPGQLASARRFQRDFSRSFPLVLASGEQPPLRSGSFDLAISEYGASIWCDPYRWIPEAARLLRRDGRLWFLTNSVLQILCMPEHDDEGPTREVLRRPQFGMHRFEWPDDPGIEFHLPHGEMIALLRENHFEIEALHELEVPSEAETRFSWIDAAWASRWPCEEIWVAKKR